MIFFVTISEIQRILWEDYERLQSQGSSSSTTKSTTSGFSLEDGTTSAAKKMKKEVEVEDNNSDKWDDSLGLFRPPYSVSLVAFLSLIASVLLSLFCCTTGILIGKNHAEKINKKLFNIEQGKEAISSEPSGVDIPLGTLLEATSVKYDPKFKIPDQPSIIRRNHRVWAALNTADSNPGFYNDRCWFESECDGPPKSVNSPPKPSSLKSKSGNTLGTETKSTSCLASGTSCLGSETSSDSSKSSGLGSLNHRRNALHLKLNMPPPPSHFSQIETAADIEFPSDNKEFNTALQRKDDIIDVEKGTVTKDKKVKKSKK